MNRGNGLWNLLLEFHDTVNVKMDRTCREIVFMTWLLQSPAKIKRAVLMAQSRSAPVAFETEQKARAWVHDNRDTKFDYLLILTAWQPVSPVSVSQTCHIEQNTGVNSKCPNI